VGAAPERPRRVVVWLGRPVESPKVTAGIKKARTALEREATVAFENVADAIAALAPELDCAGSHCES
jgi:hypothetical protein